MPSPIKMRADYSAMQLLIKRPNGRPLLMLRLISASMEQGIRIILDEDF